MPDDEQRTAELDGCCQAPETSIRFGPIVKALGAGRLRRCAYDPRGMHARST